MAARRFPTEAQVSMQLALLLRRDPVLCCVPRTHVANEGDRPGVKQKMGCEPGAPDWTFWLPGSVTFNVELKRPNATNYVTLSPEQQVFGMRLRHNGHLYEVHTNAVVVVERLRELMKETKP